MDVTDPIAPEIPPESAVNTATVATVITARTTAYSAIVWPSSRAMRIDRIFVSMRFAPLRCRPSEWVVEPLQEPGDRRERALDSAREGNEQASRGERDDRQHDRILRRRLTRVEAEAPHPHAHELSLSPSPDGRVQLCERPRRAYPPAGGSWRSSPDRVRTSRSGSGGVGAHV